MQAVIPHDRELHFTCNCCSDIFEPTSSWLILIFKYYQLEMVMYHLL